MQFVSPVLATYLFALVFFFTAPPPTEIYTLSLHDALPICVWRGRAGGGVRRPGRRTGPAGRRSGGRPESVPDRSEEHTSELQSPYDLVCRLLLEKKNRPRTTSTAARTGSSPPRPHPSSRTG